MGLERTGDWAGAVSRIGGLGKRIEAEVQRAVVQNTLLLQREVKKGIQSQAPGGQAFKKLMESTILAKGSFKALIDSGFLLASIKTQIMHQKGFVGVLRSSQSKEGGPLVNIAAVHEFGATVTAKSGRTFQIPARPYLRPTLKANKSKLAENFRAAMARVAGAQ